QDDGVTKFTLSDVNYPESGKPYWKHDDAYDFNISHSGDYIMVAASKSLNVGIDVEKIKELKRLSFTSVLSSDELIAIKKTPALFFDLWSKKEAVVKAADTAGIARMRDVKLKKSIAMLDEEKWHLKTIAIDKGYAINLATSASISKLIVKQISLHKLR
ncbi:MAG: 4'-phosphopantetheinyl transferase superfamily protein, partial [Gammaproteobacteria bacterium]|nr:4'-phosphopantetheinyl transferase superfamily protein [Gammaproteobacteria bacterium]